MYVDPNKVDLNTYIANIWHRDALQSLINNRMGCQGNEFILPSPSVDFPPNNPILKYQCPYYKNMWVYKISTWGMISPSGSWTNSDFGGKCIKGRDSFMNINYVNT